MWLESTAGDDEFTPEQVNEVVRRAAFHYGWHDPDFPLVARLGAAERPRPLLKIAPKRQEEIEERTALQKAHWLPIATALHQRGIAAGVLASLARLNPTSISDLCAKLCAGEGDEELRLGTPKQQEHLRRVLDISPERWQAGRRALQRRLQNDRQLDRDIVRKAKTKAARQQQEEQSWRLYGSRGLKDPFLL